jgi:hypothetical protein
LQQIENRPVPSRCTVTAASRLRDANIRAVASPKPDEQPVIITIPAINDIPVFGIRERRRDDTSHVPPTALLAGAQYR